MDANADVAPDTAADAVAEIGPDAGPANDGSDRGAPGPAAAVREDAV